MRLIEVLPDYEAKRFARPPMLTSADRQKYFKIDDTIRTLIEKTKQMDNQIGLMVQYGYFKACGKFFTTKAFKPTDIKAVAKILGVTVSVDFIEKYTDRTRQKHRLLILDVCGYIEFGSAIATLKKQWLTWLISKCTHTKD